MIRVIQLPEIDRSLLENNIDRNLARKGILRRRVQEVVRSETMIWMPYHALTYEFTMDPQENESHLTHEASGSGKAALNAMFSSLVEDEHEILALIRPDLIDIEFVDYIPRSPDVIGTIDEADPQLIINQLHSIRTEISTELQETASELRKIHRRMQTMSVFLPTTKSTRVREDALTQRLAQLSGMKFSIQMRLGIPENVIITKVTDTGVFYCPQLVVLIEHQQTGIDRFIFVDLVRFVQKTKGGSLDEALSRLCSENDACRAALDKIINK